LNDPVGLACARALALAGREVIVLESESTIGTGTSSRNSEVIHAGIYYPCGSLKAKLCVAGRKALYPFLARHGVPHRRCGKLVVAAEAAQIPALEKLRAQAAENGVTDLKTFSGAEARALDRPCAHRRASTGARSQHSFRLGAPTFRPESE